MEKIKQILFSERGMQIVNLLFFLSLVLRNSGVIFVFYGCWILYLTGCLRRSPSRAMRAIYRLLIAFAAVMILLNGYFLVRQLR